jgi:hypothetical protein
MEVSLLLFGLLFLFDVHILKTIGPKLKGSHLEYEFCLFLLFSRTPSLSFQALGAKVLGLARALCVFKERQRCALQ